MARMLRPRTVIVAMCVVIAAGCGNEKRAAAPAATHTPEPTATPTPKPKAAPRRAHSVRTCAQLWNADALDPNNYQVSANEFVAELAPIRVHVAYQHENCFVVMPIGNHRIAISTAAKGRRPFSNPYRRRVERGERIPYNARADRQGRVQLDL
jgi:hypothetical protein